MWEERASSGGRSEYGTLGGLLAEGKGRSEAMRLAITNANVITGDGETILENCSVIAENEIKIGRAHV